MQARPSEPPSRDQPLNPIINPCTDPRLGRIWPLPDSTFLPLQSAFVPILTPSLIYFFAPPPKKKKKSQSHPDDAAFQLHGGGSGADWGHLQAGVKQIRTSAKWISWLPLWTGGMCSVSPRSVLSGFSADGRSCHWHSGCRWMALFIFAAASRSLLREDQLACALDYSS